MIDINWLSLLILILATFSIKYMIINEITIYFSNKSYLSKWILCFIFSISLVLLIQYVPSAFILILSLAIVGGVELLSILVSLMQINSNYEQGKEHQKILDTTNQTNEMHEYYGEHTDALKNKEEKINSNIPHKRQAPTNNKTINKTKQRSPSNRHVKDPKIIDSRRKYEKDQLLKESHDQKVTLSPYLRSNLDNSKTTKK